MKIKIKQRVLLEHLNYAIKGISSKNIIPILNCIKFELKEEGLYLLSTDNEIAIKTFIESEKIDSIDELGELVISGKYIYEIIRKFSDEVINIEEVIDQQVLITTQSSSFKLNCIDPNEFPNLELEFVNEPIILRGNVFKEAISQIIFATSTQESRPVLTGVNFKLNNSNILECTATDSYRLAKRKINLDKEFANNLDIIVPSKNLNEIIRMIVEDNFKVELHIFVNKIIFRFGSLIIMSRLINGTYPDTNKSIPDNFNLKIKADLNKLYNAIDRASLLTNEEEKNIINLKTDGIVAYITSNIPEIGNVEEKIDISKDADEDIKIAFSSKYMMDAIKSFDCEKVEISFNGEIKPIIITSTENADLVQLISPIRTF